MRPYEVMVIYKTDDEESVVRQHVTAMTDLLKANGATVGSVDFWGRRRFAYRMKHHWEGYYVVLHTMAEPAAMAELSRVLGFADEVLRHKVLRIPESVYGTLGTPAEK